MNRASTEPKVTLEITITRADGTVEPTQVITNEPAPIPWAARIKQLLRGT